MDRLLIALAAAPLLLAAAFVAAPRATGAQQPAAQAGDAAPQGEPLPRLRLIAGMLVRVEGRHRVQVSELERIARLCATPDLAPMLRLAIEARHAEQQDYEKRMQEFARDLGPELYARFRAALDAGPGEAPPLRPIPPAPPPPPAPPEEIESRNTKHGEQNGEDGG